MYSLNARDHFNCSPLVFLMTSTSKQMRPKGRGGEQGWREIYRYSELATKFRVHLLTVSFSFSSCSISSLLNCAFADSKSNSPSNFSWGGGGAERTGRFQTSPRAAGPPRGIPPRMPPRNIIPPTTTSAMQRTYGNVKFWTHLSQCYFQDYDFPSLFIPGWWFGIAVTRWSRSTQLLYIKPG